MKRYLLIVTASILTLSLFPWALPAPAADQDMLQVTTLKGSFLDPQGRELAEYGYIEPGWKCRLMPGAEVELSTLDGRKTYKAVGPGVIEFDGAKTVTLNGEPIPGADDQREIRAAETGVVQGGNLGGLAIRGRDRIMVQAKTAAGATKKLPLYSGYYALVIGIGEYTQGWPGLSNPVQDAREVAALLKDLGWEVKTVENPDWEALRKSLNSLITGPGRDEEKAILVWFSGHGHTLKEADGSKLGYIVPVDAPDPGRDEMGFMERALSMRQVETVARRIMSKHVLMVFDSCFSGAIFQTTRAIPPPFIEEKVGRPVRQFITAGNENEQVPDKSYFKTVFLQGVGEGYADRNKDGYITGQELGAYLQENVVNYSHKAQHPQYGKINNPKLDKGDFVFVNQTSTAAVQAPKEAEVRVASVGNPKPTVVAEKELSGKIEVTSNVDGVKFRLTETWFQTKLGTAMVIGQVPIGDHEVLAQKEGYRDWQGKVTVKADSTVTLDIRMEKPSTAAAEEPASSGAREKASEKVIIRYRTESKGYRVSNAQMVMTLTFQGDEVRGVYDDDQGRIVGKLKGRELVGSWTNEEGRKPGLYRSEGSIRFRFSEDMKSFRGSFTTSAYEGRWNGLDGQILK